MSVPEGSPVDFEEVTPETSDSGVNGEEGWNTETPGGQAEAEFWTEEYDAGVNFEGEESLGQYEEGTLALGMDLSGAEETRGSRKASSSGEVTRNALARRLAREDPEYRQRERERDRQRRREKRKDAAYRLRERERERVRRRKIRESRTLLGQCLTFASHFLSPYQETTLQQPFW